MTDIKEPINTTSDGTFLSVVCENPEKSVVGQKLGGATAPPGITPLKLFKILDIFDTGVGPMCLGDIQNFIKCHE